jgi:gamma-glutamyl-gamma-aminobutyrate hydrolase PuuD
MNIALLILVLVPTVITLVQAIEKLITTKGKGTEKKIAVMAAVRAILSGMVATGILKPSETEIIFNALSKIIDSIVLCGNTFISPTFEDPVLKL